MNPLIWRISLRVTRRIQIPNNTVILLQKGSINLNDVLEDAEKDFINLVGGSCFCIYFDVPNFILYSPKTDNKLLDLNTKSIDIKDEKVYCDIKGMSIAEYTNFFYRNREKIYISNPDLAKTINNFKPGLIQLTPTRSLNMLLIGKTGTGKTTLFKVWEDPSYISPPTSVVSKTATPELNSFSATVTYEDNSSAYVTLNILDTPGLKETKLRAIDVRTDEEISSLISSCLKEKFIDIDVIGFVFSCVQNISNDDLEVFEALRGFIGEDWKSNSLLILTHAESRTEQSLEKFVAELKLGERHRNIVEYCSMGWAAVGALQQDTLDNYKQDLDEDAYEYFVKKKEKKYVVFKLMLWRKFLPVRQQKNHCSWRN